MDNEFLKNEMDRLGKISEFYEKGDAFDNLIIEREEVLIRKCCENYSNAIEIGCGSGYSTVKLVGYFNEYSVLEPVEKNIELLKKRMTENNNITIHNCLIEEFKKQKNIKTYYS